MNTKQFINAVKDNPDLLTALIITQKINNDAIRQAERHLKKCQLRGKPVDYVPVKMSTKHDKISQAQLNARQDIKDRMQTAKQDMIDHIKNEIEKNSYSLHAFLADPSVYFEVQVMGKYYDNYVLRQAVVRYFEKEYVPF